MNAKLLVVLVASLAMAPAFADKSPANKEETTGVGSGLVVGAILGGPVGAIVGGALGGWVGDRFHREATARVEVEQQYEVARTDLEVARTDLASLEREFHGREQRIASLESTIRLEERKYREALQEALNTQIFFRTGEAALHEDSIERLGKIAQLVASMDGFVVRLAGYADARGDEEYNAQLSAARAAAVRDALVASGFPNDRIVVTAEGESMATADEKDLDALALERRVHIELVSADEFGRVAQQ
jgi:outer membrane protein OmpA-like peptidoglycan-associated protein